ncbi:MAG: glycosyltransferase [Chitinispirillales bacterium]|jgi:cellulose synthase/poly-beta-1,6-N-acetylglucosamine synthase-like glycosyltransferase|nr:glycosyltransferase [Chitinispirillales bacterium]
MIILIPVIGFAAAILFLRFGIYRLDGNRGGNRGGDGLEFSVVVAARDEERNIAACLESIFAQGIDKSRYEAIVVDDRSSDATPRILREASERYENLRVITVSETPPGLSPKKHAVTLGIAAASRPIVAFTDADCRVPPTWLERVGACFGDGTDLVQGVTSYSCPSGMSRLFWGLQAIDFLSHGVIAGAAISAGLPINSNANNMAFRRRAFAEAGGYEDSRGVVPGDDDQLMQRIWRHGRRRGADSVKFMADPLGAVETSPTETPRALFEQRKRWGAVTVHYGLRQVVLLSAVFAFYVSIALTAVACAAAPRLLPIFASLILVKLAGELALLIPGTRIFGKKNLRKYILPASMLHLPIVLAAVFFGVFGKFTWKGKKTGRNAA